MRYWSIFDTQSNPNQTNLIHNVSWKSWPYPTKYNPIQSNPWMDPIHVQLWFTLPEQLVETILRWTSKNSGSTSASVLISDVSSPDFITFSAIAEPVLNTSSGYLFPLLGGRTYPWQFCSKLHCIFPSGPSTHIESNLFTLQTTGHRPTARMAIPPLGTEYCDDTLCVGCCGRLSKRTRRIICHSSSSSSSWVLSTSSTSSWQ